VRKLDNLVTVYINDADEIGANREYSFLCITESPIRVKLGMCPYIELNC
jgi:hypothetical protein